MAKNEIKVDRLLLDLLLKNGAEAFSITNLRDQYLTEAPSGFDPDAGKTRIMIYRQLLRIEKKGFISRQPGTSGKNVKFLFNRESSSHRLVGVRSPHWRREAAPRTKKPKPSEQAPVNAEIRFVPELQAKLRRYKMEMMTSIGEAEEYEYLIDNHPELRSDLEADYLAARDQGAKIYGQARALEKVILNHQGKTE